MHTENYVSESLELHLFFGRIMKEHSLFLKVGFTPVNLNFSAKAEFYKNEFEKLLNRAVTLSNGRISGKVLNSGEIVTEFTLIAEKQTEKLIGIPINSNITKRELNLSSCNCNEIANRFGKVKNLNQTALKLLNGLIGMKEEILYNVLNCHMFTMNYPLLIEHILREAKLYHKYVQMLETDGAISMQSMKEVELINSADAFAADYSALLNRCHNAQNRTLTVDSMMETRKFRDFKTAGAKGIENCQIRSLILPLLADHVLREANHFIRILEN